MMPDASQGQADNPFVDSLRSFAQGSSGLSNIVGMGLALTGQAGGPTTEDAAMANGVSSLTKEYSKTNDPARAVVNWAQSPDGMSAMKIPGVLPRVLDQFRKSLQPLDVTGAQIGQGNAGVINQGGVGGQGKVQQGQTPIVQSRPAGSTSVISGPNGVSEGGTTPPEDVQSFKDFAGLSGLPSSTLSQIAGMRTGNEDFSRRYAMGATLLQQGADPRWVQAWQNGTVQMFKDDKIPNMYHWVDTLADPTHMHTVIPQVEGVNSTPSMVPSWNNNFNTTSPENYSSTPKPGGQSMTGPQGVPGATAQVQHTAEKYNVPPESIKTDGTIDPVKAWGPSATFALGGGLPAMVQNVTAHMARWFDPTATSEGSEQVIQAEQGLQALQYMSTHLAEGSRVKVMVDAALGMGPEHEKWDDPASAASQMIVMRTTLEGEARVEQEAIKNMKLEGVGADNAAIGDSTRKLYAIQKVLNFLPSSEALRSEKRAIQDGMIANVPSISTAAKEGAGLVGKAIGTATGTASAAPGNQQAYMEQIARAKSPKDLSALARRYGSLDPAVQSALDDKMLEFRRGARPKAQPQTTPAMQPQAPVPFTPQSSASPGNPFAGAQ